MNVKLTSGRFVGWRGRLLLLSLVVLAVVTAGVLELFVSVGPVDAPKLTVSPVTLPGLKKLHWEVATEGVGSSSFVSVWQASGVDEGGQYYLQEVERYPSSIVARWYYWSSIRINFESDFPNKVIGVSALRDLGADSFDLFCVDIDSTHASSGQCAIWAYWARYGEFIVYINITGSDLNVNGFLDIVVSADKRLGI
ncbi:hypothetical protein [Micromonospora sp. Llam0]|uniref:hypothetical protein n=1 Tax=Micromonospora sp. Llam0 TaxID=2485143 RepID=UPI0011CD9AE4|nr:hypothetical protein [Micromonospora sp. Llam0]